MQVRLKTVVHTQNNTIDLKKKENACPVETPQRKVVFVIKRDFE